MAAALPYGAAVADDAHDLDTFCLPDALHALHAAAAPPPPPPPQSLLQARAPTPTPPPPKVVVTRCELDAADIARHCLPLAHWEQPSEQRNEPFVKCPHYRRFKGKMLGDPDILVGCSAHASTRPDLIRIFSPFIDPSKVHRVPQTEEEERLCFQEFIEFYKERGGGLLDHLPGTCRVCRKPVSAEFMHWPLDANNTAFATRRGLWEDTRCIKGMQCQAFETTVFRSRSVSSGCCNFMLPNTVVNDKDSRIGFSLDGHNQSTCNLCSHTQTLTIRFDDTGEKFQEEGVAKKEKKREADTDKVNFLSGIGITSEQFLKMPFAAARRKWSCGAHESYDHDCEACWKMHSCTCQKKKLTTLEACEANVERWWARFVEQRKGELRTRLVFEPLEMDGRAIRAMPTPAPPKPGKARTSRKETRLRKWTTIVAKAFLAFLEQPKERVLTEAEQQDVDRLWKDIDNVMAEKNFTFHDCKCDAHNLSRRKDLQATQTIEKTWALAVNAAQVRWRECMLWFFFVWADKDSPYLSPADQPFYEKILFSALKDPMLFYEYRGKRAGADCKIDTGNGFNWSIFLVMLVQFRKCVYRLNEEEDRESIDGARGDRPQGWREITPDGTTFEQGLWGVLSVAEAERWNMRAMVEYARARKHLYTNRRDTRFSLHSESRSGKTSQMVQLENAMARDNGYLDNNLHTLQFFCPPFLDVTRLSEEDGGREAALRESRRNYMYILETLDELLSKKQGANSNMKFWPGRLPNVILDLCYEDETGDYIFKDLCIGNGFVQLQGPAAEKAVRNRGGDEIARANLAWSLSRCNEPRGFEEDHLKEDVYELAKADSDAEACDDDRPRVDRPTYRQRKPSKKLSAEDKRAVVAAEKAKTAEVKKARAAEAAQAADEAVHGEQVPDLVQDRKAAMRAVDARVKQLKGALRDNKRSIDTQRAEGVRAPVPEKGPKKAKPPNDAGPSNAHLQVGYVPPPPSARAQEIMEELKRRYAGGAV